MKNRVEPERPQKTMRCMRIACWVPKAANKRSEYVAVIAFPPQQWLHNRALTLRYNSVACRVSSIFGSTLTFRHRASSI